MMMKNPPKKNWLCAFAFCLPSLNCYVFLFRRILLRRYSEQCIALHSEQYRDQAELSIPMQRERNEKRDCVILFGFMELLIR